VEVAKNKNIVAEKAIKLAQLAHPANRNTAFLFSYNVRNHQVPVKNRFSIVKKNYLFGGHLFTFFGINR
jgi:hypothetical protein